MDPSASVSSMSSSAAETPDSRGNCYIVATPIGNSDDITLRAIEVLRNVSLIACEDTRVSKGLFAQHQITARLISCHEHNEEDRVSQLLAILERGEDVALVSDAGTPLISDPGYVVVKQLAEAGVNVVPIPGCSAVIAALCISGLATDRFVFEGFLPAKSSSRLKCLKTLADEGRTMVFYEAPHRIQEFAMDAAKAFGGQRKVVHVRELTKQYEQVFRGDLAAWGDWLAQDSNHLRGEMVVLIEGVESQVALEEKDKLWLQALAPEIQAKELSKLAAKITGIPKSDIYDYLLELKQSR